MLEHADQHHRRDAHANSGNYRKQLGRVLVIGRSCSRLGPAAQTLRCQSSAARRRRTPQACSILSIRGATKCRALSGS